MYQYDIWYVTLYRWPFGVQVWMKLREQSHPNLYRNKHTQKKMCVKLVIYKDCTEMHGQQTNKQKNNVIVINLKADA